MNIYEIITDAIIAKLEEGLIPWHMPWVTTSDNAAVSHVTRRPYSLLNQILLGRPGEYLTFKQVAAEGGRVKSGAKSRMVVFWKMLNVKDVDAADVDDDADGGKTVPVLRYYRVFHIDDCEGIEPRVKPDDLPNVAETDVLAENILRSYVEENGITLVNERGNRAFYRPSTDTITLPEMAQFESTAEYYSTAFHEATHSTGHTTRLNRLTSDGFGSEAYGKEELIAEIGSACLMHTAGLTTDESFNNSAAYIQGWLSALRNDKRMIVSAAGRAEKAVKLILASSLDKCITPEEFEALIA